MLPTVAACSKSHVTLASRATLMTGWLVALVDLHVSENVQAESHSEELNLCPGQVCISFVLSSGHAGDPVRLEGAMRADVRCC